MRRYFMLVLLCGFLVPVSAAETDLIEYHGTPIEEPYWFKDSFLELADDIEEAAEEDKKLILYFHQAGCPYCFNLVQQSLLDPLLSQYIQTHFDVIALDLWGDREVTLPDGAIYSEKELAIHWKVQYTPTLIYFAGSPEPVLRIDGYRGKEMLARILDYVQSGDTETSLAQTLIKQDTSKSLYPSTAFNEGDELSGIDHGKPVAILFEYPGCEDCDQLHRRVLSRRDTNELLSGYQTYRVNIADAKQLVLPDAKITAKEWSEKLGLSFFPSMVLLDKNHQERFRIDGYVQAFHFNTALDYVAGKHYEKFPEFQRYINARADQLRASGKNVIITE